MSSPVAALFPTLLACWLALSLVFLGRTPRPGRLRLLGSLVAAVLVLMVPVGGWRIFQWIALFEPEISVTAIVMLLAGLVSRAGGPDFLRPSGWNSAWAFGAAGAMLLFPSTFGLYPVDIYSWGWCGGFALIVGGLALVLALKRNRFGAVLLLALLVEFVRPGASKNVWDVLIDPLYGAAAVLVLASRAISRLRPGNGGR